MPFQRIYPEDYPRVYDQWEDGSVEWVIQDLPAEDDEKAVKMLIEHLCTDETLCQASNLLDDPESIKGMGDFWRHFLARRLSLGCYTVKNGKKELVALNCCFVACRGEDYDCEIVGEAWKNVFDTLVYTESKYDVYEYFGTDKVLEAVGLVVSREYRGAKLGARILAAREPLCKSQGVIGSSTMFTGIASQKSAERVGFVTVAEFPLSEAAAAGMKYSKDDHRVIKLMVKKY